MTNARTNNLAQSKGKLVDTRKQIADKQSTLVASLILGSSPPVGFDRSRLAVCAKTLLKKRWRTISTIYPWLEDLFGNSLEEEFAAYVQRFPLKAGCDANNDARRFLQYARIESRIKHLSQK